MFAARKYMGSAANGPAGRLFTSLKEGMQQLVDALVGRLDANALKTSAPVQSGMPQEDGWTLSAGYESDQFDAVIIATPTNVAVVVLQSVDEKPSRELVGNVMQSDVTFRLCTV